MEYFKLILMIRIMQKMFVLGFKLRMVLFQSMVLYETYKDYWAANRVFVSLKGDRFS